MLFMLFSLWTYKKYIAFQFYFYVNQLFEKLMFRNYSHKYVFYRLMITTKIKLKCHNFLQKHR